MTQLRGLMEILGTGLDFVGVLIVCLGSLFAASRALTRWTRGTPDAYRLFRQDLGRTILLGLEFLVAGDLIRTVVVDPTPQSVLALGGIVLIRTFLSFSLQLELEGRWPWEKTAPPTSSKSPSDDLD